LYGALIKKLLVSQLVEKAPDFKESEAQAAVGLHSEQPDDSISLVYALGPRLVLIFTVHNGVFLSLYVT
jgi:hypothetical protein